MNIIISDLTIEGNRCGYNKEKFEANHMSAGLHIDRQEGSFSSSNILIKGNTRGAGNASGFYYYFERLPPNNMVTFDGFTFEDNICLNDCLYGTMVVT